MRVWALAIVLLLAGCSEPAPATDDPDDIPDVDPGNGLGAITGVVVTETITPISGALVELSSGINTTTDENGLFIFNDLEPGFFALSVSAVEFTDTQSTTDVAADETKKLKIVMTADLSPQPFHQTYSHKGFIEYSPGIAGFVLDIAAGDIVDICDCSMTFAHEDSVETYVWEAFWEETINSPVGHGGFYWELWMIDPVLDGNTGYGNNPIHEHLDAGFYDGAVEMEARLTGPDEWLAYQQDFEMHVTAFHLEPAPEGWTIDAS